MRTLAELRDELVSERANLRCTKRLMELTEARIATTIDGKNEQQRKAALLLALSEDADYREDWRRCEVLTFEVEQLEAEIENVRDARREYEWAIRLRLVEALERRGVPVSETDQAFDETLDHYADRVNEEAVGIDDQDECPF